MDASASPRFGCVTCGAGASEAEAVYRADLGMDDTVPRCCQHPDNVWSLTGLVECLEHRGSVGQLAFMQARLAIVRASAVGAPGPASQSPRGTVAIGCTRELQLEKG